MTAFPKSIDETADLLKANGYVAGRDLATVVFLALKMGRPLFLEGEAGVGKTEIARRLAGLVNAPFIKVEATKYTEVGYHGRDVESMVRDLVEAAIRIVRDEQAEIVKDEAERLTEESLIDSLLPFQLPRRSAIV